jgi:hypothetical protein
VREGAPVGRRGCEARARSWPPVCTGFGRTGATRFANASSDAPYQIGLQGYGPNVSARSCMWSFFVFGSLWAGRRARCDGVGLCTSNVSAAPPAPYAHPMQINLMRDPRWGRNCEVSGSACLTWVYRTERRVTRASHMQRSVVMGLWSWVRVLSFWRGG